MMVLSCKGCKTKYTLSALKLQNIKDNFIFYRVKYHRIKGFCLNAKASCAC